MRADPGSVNLRRWRRCESVTLAGGPGAVAGAEAKKSLK